MLADSPKDVLQYALHKDYLDRTFSMIRMESDRYFNFLN